MLTGAHRTMKIHGGWGSAPDNSFRGMDFASNFVSFYDDNDYFFYEPQYHPQLEGVFFLNKHV